MALEDHQPGIFIGVHFSAATAVMLAEWCTRNNIEYAVPVQKLHSTIVYSKEFFFGYEPLGELDEPVIVDPSTYKFELFGKDEDNKCLVLTFQSEWMNQRNAEAMRLGASTDFPKYRPHVTLSYKYPYGEEALKTFKPPVMPLEIAEEYFDEINPDWSKLAASFPTILELSQPLTRIARTNEALVQVLSHMGYENQGSIRLNSSKTTSFFKLREHGWDNPAEKYSNLAIRIDCKENKGTIKLQADSPISLLQDVTVTNDEKRLQLIQAANYMLDGMIPEYTTIAEQLTVTPSLNLKPIPSIWFENEKGDRYVPDMRSDNPDDFFPPKESMEEFKFQRSRFGNIVRDNTLRLLFDSGRTSSSENVIGFERTWNEELALAIHRNENVSLHDAIIMASECCERCWNKLGQQYGLPGCAVDSYNPLNMHCEMCRQVDPEYHYQHLILDDQRRMNRQFYDNIQRTIQPVENTDTEPTEAVPVTAAAHWSDGLTRSEMLKHLKKEKYGTHVYHGTSAEKAQHIASSGHLKPSQGNWKTDKPSVHFSGNHIESVSHATINEKKGVLFRAKHGAIKFDGSETRASHQSSRKIPLHKLQVLTHKGWVAAAKKHKATASIDFPIAEYRLNKVLAGKFTIADVNKALKKELKVNIELVKGRGYFYFVGDAVDNATSTSVMVYRLSDLTVSQWVDEAREILTKVATRQSFNPADFKMKFKPKANTEETASLTSMIADAISNLLHQGMDLHEAIHHITTSFKIGLHMPTMSEVILALRFMGIGIKDIADGPG